MIAAQVLRPNSPLLVIESYSVMQVTHEEWESNLGRVEHASIDGATYQNGKSNMRGHGSM